MKKEKLTDYILHLKNWVPKEIVKTTLKEISKKKWEPHFHINSVTLKKIVRKKELENYGAEESLTYYKELHELLWKVLEKYILKEYKQKYHNGWASF
mgnify:FL=1